MSLGVQKPKALELELRAAVRQQVWVMGTNLGSLKEQQVLLTPGPSLQPQTAHLKKYLVEIN